MRLAVLLPVLGAVVVIALAAVQPRERANRIAERLANFPPDEAVGRTDMEGEAEDGFAPMGRIADEEEIEIEEVEPGDPPPDPVETGPCTLFLSLVAEGSREPVAASVQLWRLDAPDNEDWTRGDQLQRSFDVPAGGLLVRDLPAGRYRTFATGQRRDSDDPPAFEVSDHAEVTLALPMPRKFQVYVKVFTETGHLLARATREACGASSYSSSGRGPSWRKYRRPRNGRRYPISISCGTGCGGSRVRSEVVATERGFDHGRHAEASRRSSNSSTFYFKSPGRTDVKIFLKNDVPRDRTYVGITVPRDRIVDSIVMPDGRLAIDAGAKVDTTCEVVLQEPDTEWRRLPVKVRVSLEGAHPLEFEYRLGDPLPVRTLELETDG